MTTAEKIALAQPTSPVGKTRPENEAFDKGPEKASDKRRALGRGLDSLLPGKPHVVSPVPSAGSSAISTLGSNYGFAAEQAPVLPEGQAQAAYRPPGDQVLEIPLDEIDENPYQTRRQFDTAAIEELTESIRANGL